MATTDYSHGQQLTGACPQCGAAPAGTETHCRFCQTALHPPTAPPAPPNPMMPPPMMNQPMTPPLASQSIYYPTVAVTSSRGWAAYWIIIAVVTVLVPLAIVAFVLYSVNSSVDSITATTFPTPTFTPPTFDTPSLSVPKTPEIPAVPTDPSVPSVPTTPTVPSAPEVPAGTATNIEGNGQTKTIDCSSGQNFVIVGNAMKITASGGVCGTIIVKGNGTTATIDAAKEVWVTGNSDTVTVTKAGKITTTGNASKVTYTEGLDGAEPTIQKGGNLSTITKAS